MVLKAHGKAVVGAVDAAGHPRRRFEADTDIRKNLGSSTTEKKLLGHITMSSGKLLVM